MKNFVALILCESLIRRSYTKLSAHQCDYFHHYKMTSNIRAMGFCTANMLQSDKIPIKF